MPGSIWNTRNRYRISVPPAGESIARRDEFGEFRAAVASVSSFSACGSGWMRVGRRRPAAAGGRAIFDAHGGWSRKWITGMSTVGGFINIDYAKQVTLAAVWPGVGIV